MARNPMGYWILLINKLFEYSGYSYVGVMYTSIYEGGGKFFRNYI